MGHPIREAQAKWDRQFVLEAQNIGRPPKPPGGKRWKGKRLASDESLEQHLRICYPSAVPLAFSADHLRLIKDIERAAEVGLLKALAMPRGSGKTTIMVRAGLWSLLTGRRKFCCIVAATDAAARELLKGLQTEILFNQHLQRYYHQELWAVIKLDSQSRRCQGQHIDGEKTNPTWNIERLGFGHVPGMDKTNGAFLTTCGITGAIRGQQVVTSDGNILRPDLVLIDDPQTKESAASETQCQKRHETMMGDVLGLAGPDRSISGITTCTIIYRGDLADRILNRELSPDWQGEVCRMVNRWPANLKRWDQYAAIRAADLAAGGTGEKATRYYVRHRKEMDEGAEVSWPERKGSDKSAIQHAWNLRLRDEPAFFAEFQNQPLGSGEDLPFDLRVDDISRRVIESERSQVPPEAEKLVAFVDVQKELLFYVVMAWSHLGRGVVIDYGSYPDQDRPIFDKRDARFKLADLPGVTNPTEGWYSGLTNLTGDLLSRDFLRIDGASLQISRLAIDSGYGSSTALIRRFCSESPYKGQLFPSKGKYMGANSKPWHQLAAGQRDHLGLHCKLQPPPNRQFGNRELQIDVNWWKTFAAERLLCPIGSNRAIALYRAEPYEHRMFAEHCCAEDPTLCLANTGEKAIEWKQNPGKPNNDYWDCLVGCCCLASLEGIEVQHEAPQKPKRGRKKPEGRGKVQFSGKVR